MNPQNYNTTHFNTKSTLSLTNNSLHSEYFYPTQLSPIYEPETESVGSSNTSPVSLPRTNGFFSTNQYTLYNNNNKYIENNFVGTTESTLDRVSVDKNGTEKNGVHSSSRLSDIKQELGNKSETNIDPNGDTNPEGSDNSKGSCDGEMHTSSISFKSVLSAIQASKKFSKFRALPSLSQSSTEPSSSTPPMVTINNDAIISSPFKTRFINQFKSSISSKENAEEGEVLTKFDTLSSGMYFILFSFR